MRQKLGKLLQRAKIAEKSIEGRLSLSNRVPCLGILIHKTLSMKKLLEKKKVHWRHGVRVISTKS